MKRLLMLAAMLVVLSIGTTAMAGWRHRAVVVAPCYNCAPVVAYAPVVTYRPVVVAPYYYPGVMVYRAPVLGPRFYYGW
ncbi:MAG: hypothetical protein JSS27_04320 [Planctomycetes bacterium]|nr:hypothetical protein [Planctomycetota bacterium]